jgi:hypothetical protein
MILTFLYQNVSKHLHAHYTEAIETLTDWLKMGVFASSVLVNDMRTKQQAPSTRLGIVRRRHIQERNKHMIIWILLAVKKTLEAKLLPQVWYLFDNLMSKYLHSYHI